MLVKTITWTDYNGNERTEDFYFDLSQAEAFEMELSEKGGLTEMCKRIVAAQDGPTIIKVFKEMILKSYGEKSPDGREFVKGEELSRKFSQTGAYSKLFMELATNAEAAAEFANGITPKIKEDTNKSVPATN